MNEQPYCPAYKREGFRQSLGDREGWVLDEGDKVSGALVYRKGDEVAVVPNIWYNQPVEWRIEAMLWQAERARNSAERLRKDPFLKDYDRHKIKDHERTASRLEALAARSEEHTSELQSLMRFSYAVFCLKKKTHQQKKQIHTTPYAR